MAPGEFEGPSSTDMGVEAEPESRIALSQEEVRILTNSRHDDPALLELMAAKGIQFDTDSVKVTIDGVNHLMDTSQDEFGTLSGPDDNWEPDVAPTEKPPKIGRVVFHK